MTTALSSGNDRTALSPAVVDTNVFTAILRTRSPLAAAYTKHLRGRVLAVTYETVAEARYGALRGGWGQARVDRLEGLIGSTPLLPVDDEGASAAAQLRHQCAVIGHPLHQAEHTADRWIAATAIRWSLPLISHDGIFVDCPGLTLITELAVTAPSTP